jgi:hypothetical protein
MLTTGRFDSACAKSTEILEANKIGTKSLDSESELAMTFILTASNVLKGDIKKGYFNFGGLSEIYKKRPEQGEPRWTWRGTRQFLETYKDVNSSYRLLLLNIIKALESGKQEGLPILKDVAVAWERLPVEDR